MAAWKLGSQVSCSLSIAIGWYPELAQAENQGLMVLGTVTTEELSGDTIGGMCASGNGSKNTHPADFDWFDYDSTLAATNFKVASLKVSPSKINVNASAHRTANLVITSDTTWNVSPVQIRLSANPKSGFNSRTVRFTAAKNPDTTARSTAVVAIGTGLSPQTITVTQAAASPTSIKETERENTPTEFHLSQNCPNPFSPLTTIEYPIVAESLVRAKVYDLLGREVKTLVNEEMPAGKHTANFDATELSSGIYFCQMRPGVYSQTKKMALMR